MTLTGLPFLVVLVVAAAALVGGTMALWDRWRRPWALPARLLCLLLIMATGAVLAGDVVNRDYGFYSSFDDLLGRVPAQGTVVSTPGPLVLDPTDKGRLIRVVLAGARSGLRRSALVYLPAAYFQRADARRRFPVIELFHGFPGNPTNWVNQLHFDRTLDSEIAAGRMPPVIGVVPLDNDPGRDSECVDAVRGQKDETYLAVDVPADVQRRFRALGSPREWATIGYSTGGFCAVNLALHHPDRYAAAASLSGYFTAIVDGTAADLYRGQAAARRYNSPQWLVARHPTSVALYLVASRGDPQAMLAMARMRRAVHRRSPLTTVTLPAGGHNFHVWYDASLAAFRWLGAHLATPP